MAGITTTQTFSDGDTVTAAKLNNIVANASIDNGGIAAGKLANDSVQEANMANNSVDTNALVNDSVQNSKLQRWQPKLSKPMLPMQVQTPPMLRLLQTSYS
jgi:hypothetical protein